MRQLRRLLSVLVMAVTIVGMSATAFAQEDVVKGGSGSLTIANASKGVVYSVYKVFDAKVNADGRGFVQADELLKVGEYLRNPAMADYIRTTRKGITSLWEKMEEMNGHEMDKIHALFKSQDERLEAKQRIMELGDLSISDSMGTNLEINAPGVNKGMGLIQLGRLLGIEREEIMACGDGNNDLMMLKEVGFGVAMANGADEVKEVADYITLSNEEDGVAAAIEKFVLNPERG